jgi:hypothetical protein
MNDDSMRSRAMRLSIAEGAAWAIMVGCSETYFVANAVRLGASPLELGLVVSLPLALGSLGPLLTLLLLRGPTSRLRWAARAALLQATALGLLPLLEMLDALDPRRLIAVVCLYQIAGQMAGTAWASWIGDVVPREIRGRYFGRRNAVIQIATCSGLILAGVVLQVLEPGAPVEVGRASGGLGYILIFCLGMCARLFSAALLIRSPEPSYRGLPDRAGTARFLGSGRGRMATRLVILGGILHVTVYSAAPYFNPYMLQTLRFTYLQFMLSSVWVVLWKSLLLQVWGHSVDKRGARRVLGLALILVGIVPLPWMAADALPLVLAAQLLSAVAWSGHEVATFALMLEASTRRTRPQLFASQSVVHGLGQLGGTLLGAALLHGAVTQYTHLFGMSAVGRLIVAFIAFVWLPTSLRRRAHAPALRPIGLRPHGGVVHRPLPGDADESDEEPGSESAPRSAS